MDDHKKTLQIEYDDNSKRAKPILFRFEANFWNLTFDEKFFFSALWGFTQYRDYKLTNAIHADSPAVHTGEKFFNLNTKAKIRLTCDVFDGFVVNDVKQPILYGFVFDEPLG